MINWQFIHEKSLKALTDPEIIQKLCDQFQIKPTRGAGQNFLIDPSILDEMLAAAEIKKDNCILEIGPGFGALTVALAQKAKQVVAVEKDPRVFEALTKIMEPYKNIELIFGDALKIPLNPPFRKGEATILSLSQRESQRGIYQKGEPERDFKLVANLPYSITSAVLRKFTEPEPSLRDDASSLSDGRPSLIVVMVQKEVAERVCARPGEMSLLSVAVQFYGQPEIIKVVPRSAFWPEPEVDSAILKISNYELGRITNIDIKKFFQIVKIGFSSRRKQLQNNLAAGLHISNEKAREIIIQAGFDPKVRAQEFSVEDWKKLVKFLIFNS